MGEPRVASGAKEMNASWIAQSASFTTFPVLLPAYCRAFACPRSLRREDFDYGRNEDILERVYRLSIQRHLVMQVRPTGQAR